MKKRRLLSLVGAAVVTAGLFTGCSSSSTESKVAETVTITDRNGEVEVPKNPENVVVLDLGSLDILDELGVEVAGLPKSNLPKYLEEYKDEKYTDIGGVKEFSFETINELEPDLIIIEGRQADSLEELSKIAPTIQLGSVGTDYYNGLKSNADTLGVIFGKEDEVAEKFSTFDARINAINEKVKSENLNALVAMVSDGSMGVYGSGSRYNIIFNELGFAPTDAGIEVSNHGQSISNEYLAEKNPGYLFVLDKGQITGTDAQPAKELIENELVKTTDTYKNGNIVYLDTQAWYVGGAGFKALDAMLKDVEGVL
ncbi:MAG: siderophore ABC transporter substrate-binding protein [Clostridium sp.]|nr:siderophore ABC transporter substrate-binding protein [Clostridium sp.]